MNLEKGINVLSLFDGISCGQLALERAGIKINKYYASEIDKHAIKVTQNNYPNTIQLGSVVDLKGSDLQDIDLIIGGSPCFVAGTKILTNLGYKNIEDVIVGDMVLSHTGNWRKVLKTGGKKSSPTRLIRGYGNLGITTTDEHPFYTREMYREYSIDLKTSLRKFTNPTWCQAKDIGDKTYLSNVETIDNKIESEYSEIFWYMIGRYTGDGWYRKTKRLKRKNSFMYQFIICCGKHEFDELKSKFDEFGMNYNFSEERTGFKFRICNMDLVSFVEKIGKGASNKIVHPLLFTETLQNKKAYLAGLFDSDGHFIEKTDTQNLYSTSQYLLLGVQKIILDVYNRPTTMLHYKRRPTCIIEGRTVNQKDSYSISFHTNIRKQDKAFNENGYNWIPSKYNELTGINERVYNLEVEIDNSYTANNLVVHNCQSFSFAGKRQGMTTIENEEITDLKTYMRMKSENFNFNGHSYLFWEYNRILHEVKPKYFLLENVVMKTEWENIISESVGVDPILINSSLVSAQHRSRLYWTNIPNVVQPNDKGINLIDILDDKKLFINKATIVGRRISENGTRDDYNKNVPITQCLEVRASNQNKSNCITTVAKDNVLTSLPIGRHVDAYGRKLPYRNYSINELCKLQTVPTDYFKGLISDNQIRKTLGNGWTVDVIAHIFSFLK